MGEKDLIIRLKAGDGTAFRELVNTYSGRLYGAAVIMVGNKPEAEDAVQEAFVASMKAVKRFRGESSLYTWLARILYFTCMKTLRKRYKWYGFLSSAGNEPSFKAELPGEWETKHRNLYAVSRAMEALNLEEKQAIYQSFFEGSSQAELAGMLKCSVGKVNSVISRAKDKMRKYLEKE
jgi:RNA polymerase sigma-70 factor, ECF subfamily